VVPLPDRLGAAPEGGTGSGTAAGIGMLHGVGVESPTQIAVFVASASVVGWAAGLAILAAWCVGVVLANSGLAVLAGFGLLEARRNFVVYATVAVLVAVGSIVMGTLYLFEFDVLPAITI
jgi:high-affinity nickel-transport protein